jgi:hypothetical protein
MFRQRDRARLRLESPNRRFNESVFHSLAVAVPTIRQGWAIGFVPALCLKCLQMMILPERFVPAPIRNAPSAP